MHDITPITTPLHVAIIVERDGERFIRIVVRDQD
jgi:hypothetical protein